MSHTEAEQLPVVGAVPYPGLGRIGVTPAALQRLEGLSLTALLATHAAAFLDERHTGWTGNAWRIRFGYPVVSTCTTPQGDALCVRTDAARQTTWITLLNEEGTA